MSSPHALVLPMPCLGHINPLMHLSHFLCNHGFKITYVHSNQNPNTIAIYHENLSNKIRMVSIPDVLSSSENRFSSKFLLGLEKNMPAHLEQVIQEINEEEGERKITCMIADCGMAWAFQVAEKMGLRAIAFCPASAAHLAVSYLGLSKLMEDGVIDENGFSRNQEKFRLTATATATAPLLMDRSHLIWNYIHDHPKEEQQIFFHYFVRNNKALLKAGFILSNSCEELELPIFTNFPNIIPIGPLPTKQFEKINTRISQFSEDMTCMTWLDQQQPDSVVYISFGSIAELEQNQFQELALGIELSQMHFLWIIRPDVTNENNDVFLTQFLERVKERGKIAEWCNQNNVLAHPSVASFVSHCGWNSTLDGIKNGLRFLCWPIFADQFANRDYICDEINIGLRVIKNENGDVTKENIKSSLIELMKNDEMKAKAQKLKEIVNKSMAEGGSSFTNLNRFIKAMKQ